MEKTEHDTISRVSKLREYKQMAVVPDILLPRGAFLIAKGIRLMVRRNKGGRRTY